VARSAASWHDWRSAGIASRIGAKGRETSARHDWTIERRYRNGEATASGAYTHVYGGFGGLGLGVVVPVVDLVLPGSRACWLDPPCERADAFEAHPSTVSTRSFPEASQRVLARVNCACAGDVVEKGRIVWL